MKKKFFDFRLYADALKQTRLIGIFATVVYCLEAVIMAVGQYISVQDQIKYTGVCDISVLNFVSMHPIIVTSFCILAPMLTLSAFGFLNKRSTSDFWHSVPQTRQCVFTVFFTAVMSWILISVLVSSGISVAAFSAMSKYFAINWSTVFSFICSMLASSLLIAGATVTAMSITGTLFTNILVALMLIFLPRALLLFINLPVTTCYLIDSDITTNFLSNSLNIVFGIVAWAMGFQGTSIMDILASWPSVGYTFGVGILYSVLGCILFVVRKSESASSSAVNKYLQTAIRITVSFIVCLIPLYMLFLIISTKEESWTSDNIFFIVVMYIIVLAVYFLYELITTKKAKNLLKTIPALGILVVLNAAMLFAMNTIYKAEYNYQPVANEVDSVKIINSDCCNESDYFRVKSGETEIKNSALTKMLCEKYQDTKKIYENGNLYQGDATEFTLTVGFGNSGAYKYRRVMMSEEEYNTVISEMSKSENIRKLYCNLSELFDKAEFITVSATYYDNISIESESIKSDFLAAYAGDVEKLGFEKWYSISQNFGTECITYLEGEDEKYSFCTGEIYGNITSGNSVYSFRLPVCTLLKESYDIAMKYLFKAQGSDGSRQAALDVLKDFKNSTELESVDIELYNGISKTPPEWYCSLTPVQIEKLYDILSKSAGECPDSDSRIAMLSYSGNDKEGYFCKYVYFRIPDDADLMFLLDSESFSSVLTD